MVKEALKKAVPDFVKQTPEWIVFLRWISQNKVRTRDQLKKKLSDEIKECQKQLKTDMKTSVSGTKTRIIRQCAKKLSFLKLARDKIVKYL